jgi:hypothetical protein
MLHSVTLGGNGLGTLWAVTWQTNRTGIRFYVLGKLYFEAEESYKHLPHLRKVPGKRWIRQTHPMWLWGHSLFKISSPRPVFHGTKWLPWRPHKQSPTFHLKCRIDKGLINRGSTTDHWWSQCTGRIIMAHWLRIQVTKTQVTQKRTE